MRIAINCLDVDPDYVGGVKTYVLGLLDGFASTHHGCKFQLITTESNSHVFRNFSGERFQLLVLDDASYRLQKALTRAALLSRRASVFERVSNRAFRRFRDLLDADADIIYTPTVVLRWFDARRPTVLSMHDIQHVHYPEFFNWSRRLSRRIAYGLSAVHATCIQASSTFIKRDLISHFAGMPPSKICIINEGVDLKQFCAARDYGHRLDKYELPQRYLVYPAQLWPHKNHLTVLKALRYLEISKGIKIPLVLTGGQYSASRTVFDYIGLHGMDYVRYLGKVPVEDLVSLYQQAAALISASLHESSSLPILEAAAVGTPIVASRIPPHEEAAKVFRMTLFETRDDFGLAHNLLQLWQSHSAAFRDVSYNRSRAAEFAWENVARQYLTLFEQILN